MAVADNMVAAAATLASADDICYRCKLTGHRAKDCPTKKTKQQQQQQQPTPLPIPYNTTATPPPAHSTTTSSAAAADDTKICYRCKQSGHFASACPDKKRAREAEATTTTSHSQPVQLDTAAPATAASSDVCYRCQQIGHRASACPTKKRQKTADATATDSSAHSFTPVTVDSASSTAAGRRCYICKSADHLSSVCPSKDKQYPTARPHPPAATSRPPTIKPCYRCQATTHSTIDCPVPKYCHYCQSASHLAADCPDKRSVLRQREREKEKACNRCNELGHIERECPTLPHRRVWRQEGKERAMGCYVCGSVEHHAVECTEVTGLEARMKEVERRWGKGEAVGENECERLLVSCAAALEYRGAVWLLQQMNDKGVAVTAGGWEAMERLHSVSGKDQSRVELATISDIKKPKQQLATHIKQHRASQRHTQVQSHLAAIVDVLQRLAATAQGVVAAGGGVVVAASAFALCGKLREVLGEGVLSAKESREAVMALVKDGRLKKGSKGLVWQPEVSGKGGEKAGEAKDGKTGEVAGVEDEREKKRRQKRAQEKKRKAAKKQKMAALQQTTATVSSATTTP